MPEMTLIRRGRALLPANALAEEAMMKLSQGKPLKARISQPRNQQVHETFFAVIADVCQHWPHGHEFQPEGDAEYLRAWLLCKAGHREVFTFPIPDDEDGARIASQSMVAFVGAMKGGRYPFIRPGNHVDEDGVEHPCINVFLAKSISHDAMDEVAFRPIKSAVFEIIEGETGIRVDDLIAEHKTGRAA